jgi:hypothetical protein
MPCSSVHQCFKAAQRFHTYGPGVSLAIYQQQDGKQTSYGGRSISSAFLNCPCDLTTAALN